MIVWIASYPRSGNTLTRQILNRCLGQKSYAIYNPPVRTFASLAGHQQFEGPLEAFLSKARIDAEIRFVKTHEMDVPEGERMLYIVRDGRAAMSSYRRFQAEINGLRFSLEDIVRGQPPLVSWSDHVRWGVDRAPAATLVLRFEQLTAAPDESAQRISAFTKLPVLQPFDIRFAELTAADPARFAVGRNGPGVEDLEASCHDLFWQTHGEMMRRLGYGSTP